MARRNKQDRSAYNRAYRERNREKLQKKSREWYENNRDIVAQKAKVYRASLPKEVLQERRKRWAAAHRDKEKKRYHATRTWLPWLNAFRGSKARAKKHNVPFTLTKEWAITNWTGRCTVTDLEFVLSTKRSPYLLSPSLDRIVPSLGYTPDNSRFVLHAVNALKGAGTDDDMLTIARAIVASKTLVLIAQ